MLNWFLPTGKPVHILLSKSDKLSRQQATETITKAKAELAKSFPNCTVQLFSSLKRVGIEEAEKVIGSWLNQPSVEEAVAGEAEKKP